VLVFTQVPVAVAPFSIRCPKPNICYHQELHQHVRIRPAWRQAYSTQYPAKSGIVEAFTQSLICHEITPNEPPDDFPMDDTVSFPDNNNNFFINNSNDIADTHNAMDSNDFEHTNFQQFLGVNELEALVNPSQALFTNTRHVEVMLLKILAKLEAPLWAFKIIMNWACDAAQTGYNLFCNKNLTVPNSKSYNQMGWPGTYDAKSCGGTSTWSVT
jgi:hypothetical protein